MTRRWPASGHGRLALAHATGFCKEVWAPVVTELRAAGEERSIIAWDAPGHGDAEPLSSFPVDWWDFARHGLEVISGITEPVVGVGHSMGGAALAMAELLAPGRFAGLVLIEPVIFPLAVGRRELSLLVQGALRRRDGFKSIDAAVEHYRRPFASWDRRALEAYVRGGLVERDGVWRLKCRPEVEAEVYRGGITHGAYLRLGELDLPVLVLAGERSAAFTADYIAEFTALIPNARFEILPNASHFAPMERPDLVAAQIVSFVAP
ncbi:MAG: alpha/beta hydrolase [Actinobacteria bacterium]|nr:alpha/beta hydrolase [Actinomycetota bacterium]